LRTAGINQQKVPKEEESKVHRKGEAMASPESLMTLRWSLPPRPRVGFL